MTTNLLRSLIKNFREARQVHNVACENQPDAGRTELNVVRYGIIPDYITVSKTGVRNSFSIRMRRLRARARLTGRITAFKTRNSKFVPADARRGEIRNKLETEKHEARNQINSKEREIRSVPVLNLSFWISDLFRISCFGFRVWDA